MLLGRTVVGGIRPKADAYYDSAYGACITAYMRGVPRTPTCIDGFKAGVPQGPGNVILVIGEPSQRLTERGTLIVTSVTAEP